MQEFRGEIGVMRGLPSYRAQGSRKRCPTKAVPLQDVFLRLVDARIRVACLTRNWSGIVPAIRAL